MSTPSRATKAVLLARRRVLGRLAARRTPSWLDQLARFGHPRASSLARALNRMRDGDAGPAEPWVRRIEAERDRLMSSREPLAHLGAEGPWDRGLTVRDACAASRRPSDALALHQLVRELGPERVLELGTNCGISSAYMASALPDAGKGKVVTLEASPARSEVARRLHANLGITNVEYVLGLFDRTLDGALEGGLVDFAFIDGHHQYEPTLDYFDRIWRHSTEGAVFVFDDIRWSLDMERAWRRLKTDPRLAIVVDLCGMGVGVGTRQPAATRRFETPILDV